MHLLIIGELIPNKLAQQLIKVEMGKFRYARVYFLEGFPREAQQVEDFEKNVNFFVKIILKILKRFCTFRYLSFFFYFC